MSTPLYSVCIPYVVSMYIDCMCMPCLAFVSAAEFRPAAARACSSTLVRGSVVGRGPARGAPRAGQGGEPELRGGAPPPRAPAVSARQSAAPLRVATHAAVRNARFDTQAAGPHATHAAPRTQRAFCHARSGPAGPRAMNAVGVCIFVSLYLAFVPVVKSKWEK